MIVALFAQSKFTYFSSWEKRIYRRWKTQVVAYSSLSYHQICRKYQFCLVYASVGRLRLIDHLFVDTARIFVTQVKN